MLLCLKKVLQAYTVDSISGQEEGVRNKDTWRQKADRLRRMIDELEKNTTEFDTYILKACSNGNK